jgi:hypothetical protein
MRFVKDPDAELDYTFNWADWLGLDTISSSTVVADDGVVVESTTSTTTTVTVWLSGGDPGVTYGVRCRIVTAAARTDDRTMQIVVRER